MGDDKTDTGTVDLDNGRTVGGVWRIHKKLGEGGCGSVYLVKSIEDETEAALKAESNFAAGGCVLKLEVAILKKLSGKPHVAQLMCAARTTQFSYLIMTLLGDSLSKISKKCGRVFTVSTQARIAANTLFCLKQIHDIGFIHRDLKPANMALGRKGTEAYRFFHVLDFGLARQFVVPQNDQGNKLKMRRPRERALFRGTTRYCSIRMHDRSEQGRVDDLWSMLYLLAELRGPLPWNAQSDKRVVGEMKRLHSDEVILQNSPMEFLEIAKHLRTLTYFHRPDYQKIFLLLVAVMEKGKFSWNDPFDWENPKKAVNSTFSASPSLTKKSAETLKTTQKSRESVFRSKEMVSGSAEPSCSAEPINMSAEKATTRSNETISADRRAEILKILPFDPEFFNKDPIGF